MAKQPTRKGLDTLGVAAKGDDDMLTTAIHIPRSTWKLLRAVAFKRANDSVGRASVSALLVDLTEQHREELEKEAGPLLQ